MYTQTHMSEYSETSDAEDAGVKQKFKEGNLTFGFGTTLEKWEMIQKENGRTAVNMLQLVLPQEKTKAPNHCLIISNINMQRSLQ